MELVECKDGTSIYVNDFYDLIELIRDKVGEQAARILENNFNFEILRSTMDENFEKLYKNYNTTYENINERIKSGEFDDGNTHIEIAFNDLFMDALMALGRMIYK